MKIDLPDPFAVVCHDAGAANLILAWLKADQRLHTTRPVMWGPAAKSWDRMFPERATCGTAEAALQGAAALLSGTGWQSDLEHNARKRAISLGLKTVAVLDHWINYPERFTRGEETILPDELWVVDEYAAKIAASTFEGCVVRKMPDLYLQSQLSGIGAPPADGPAELLYVLEPTRTDWGRGVQGEFQALDYFFDHLSDLGLPDDLTIRLRVHPAEPRDKYVEWLKRYPGYRLVMDDSGMISEALTRASWVAGCESSALTLALAAGRRVYCTMPPWAPLCRLPHAGLIHIKDLPPQ